MEMPVQLPRLGSVVRELAVVIFCLVALCPNARGGSCVSGTLASYEALGAGGCSIGTNLFYSFGGVGGTAGATEIDPTQVSINPSGGTGDPELSFAVDQNADTGDLLESIFTYQITGNTYLQSAVTLGGSSETVDGAVTDIQNLCEGGTFGPDGVTGCTGTPNGLVLLDGFLNSDSTPLGSPTLLSVTDDFTLDGGTAGTASGGTFSDQFEAAVVPTPEPRGALPLGLFMLLVFVAWEKRKERIHTAKGGQ